MLWYFSESIPLRLQKYLGAPGNKILCYEKPYLNTIFVDERVKDWFLLNSPLCLILVFFTYALIVIGGTCYMKNREPLKLKLVLIIYNTFQVLYSIYVCKEVFISAYLGNYKMRCTDLDISRNIIPMRVCLYYIS